MSFIQQHAFFESSQITGNNSYDTIDISTTLEFDSPQSMFQQTSQLFPSHRFNESYEINDENAVQQNTDICVPLPLKSRLRSHNTARPQLMHITSNEELPDSKKARPVVFSKNRPARRGKSNLVNSKTIVRKYTLNDLIRECHSQEMNDTPFVSCHLAIVTVPLECMMQIDAFLMDPQGYQFVASTIELNHDSWLDVARYVAVRARTNSMSKESLRSVSFLMSVEFWFEDVALECRAALKNTKDDIALSSLVNYNFIDNEP